jgi:hypothetical protein
MEDELRKRRQEPWVRPMRRLPQIVEAAGGRQAVRAAQERARAYVEDHPHEASDALPAPIRDAWRRWSDGFDSVFPPPPSDVLPIPRAGAEVWAEARRLLREEGDVGPLLQLAALKAFREVHGDDDRMHRERIRP